MTKRTVTDEAFLTSPILAERCVHIVSDRYDLGSFDLCVEPSAGDGVFLDLLPEDRRVGIDINPRRSDLVARDFLRWQPEDFDQRILVIGNPPFGQRAAIAVQFIKHASRFANVIAFILPRSFNKDTFQHRVPPEFHLVHSEDCDDVFRTASGEQHVRTVFQIWERGDQPRLDEVRRSTHAHFEMKHAHLSRTAPEVLASLREEYPFTIPQVGANFGPRDSASVVKGSHWFIKPNVEGVRDVFERLDFSFLRNKNTAHTSLSRADIVQAYETALREHND